MTDVKRFAVILTHNRPELLSECVAAISPQVDEMIVIDNASNPAVRKADLVCDPACSVKLIQVPDQPPNLSRFWNLGIDTAVGSSDPGQLSYVAFLCDDAIVPSGWFAAVSAAMTATGAAAGCSSDRLAPGQHDLKLSPDSDLWGRMVGWAFIVDTTKGIRADEDMHWWWGDSTVDFEARGRGGMVTTGGFSVSNARPNDFTFNKPELAERAGKDGEAFVARWGFRPW